MRIDLGCGRPKMMPAFCKRPSEQCDATALIDRRLLHAVVIHIRGNSYRMREHQDLLRSRTASHREEIPG